MMVQMVHHRRRAIRRKPGGVGVKKPNTRCSISYIVYLWDSGYNFDFGVQDTLKINAYYSKYSIEQWKQT